MYCQILKNDILRSKLITLTITLFVTAAVMLVSLAAILMVNLAGSVDTLMQKSKTTHFMQMHSVNDVTTGILDHQGLKHFAAQNENVEAWQVLEFLNIDGAQMLFSNTSLADNMQDNGLCIQSEKFDFLLDLDGNVISAKDGELYVPVCYLRQNITRVGDTAVICGKPFTVAGFLRDSQMNSALSSSKRFLVSERDFEALRESGRIEYLIEFRVKDLSALGAFETSYTEASLPANGPTITYGLFKILNSFSDGLMIGVILLVSLLVVGVAFLCIRFTLLAKIEEDFREIGVMKAIGLRVADIRKIYLVKYAVIGGTGCLMGYLLSLALDGILIENVKLYMGESTNDLFALLLAACGALLVFFFILAYVALVLRRLSNISAAEAIRFGCGQEKTGHVDRFSLSRSRFLPSNIFLGMQDVFLRKKMYGTMLLVLIIASFIMIVPQNLYHTISAKDFSTYMGIGNCSLRVDLQQTDHIAQKANEIKAAMETDADITKSVVLTTKIFKTGTEENLKVELGDHTVFPIVYSKGRLPTTETEIALSAMNADVLGKEVGDHITLITGQGERSLTVCGIYSDITNGGKTAKAAFTDEYPSGGADTMWSIVLADVTDEDLIPAKVSSYGLLFSDAKIAAIDSYIAETFGQTIYAVQKAAYVAFAMALGITLLVTLLFMKMLIAKDRYSIAVMKAVGFTSKDIRWQYIVRSFFILLLGVLLGTLLANTVGEVLGGMAISSFGASSFHFTKNPILAYLLCPLGMVCTVLIGGSIGTSKAGKIKLSEHIKE